MSHDDEKSCLILIENNFVPQSFPKHNFNPHLKKIRFFITKLRVLKKLESCSIDNIFSYAATPPFSFSGLSFLMSEKKRKLKKIFKLSGLKKSSNYHSINLVFKNNFSPKKFFWQFAHNLCKQLQLEFCADEATTEKFTTFPMLTGHFAIRGH